MKFFSASTAALLALLASSTLAADTTTTSLRARSTMSDPTPAAAAKTTKNTKDNNVQRGEKSYLKFYNGKCVGFDHLQEGQEAKLVNCGDSDAAWVTYRDDRLIEVYSSNSNNNDDYRLCLEERGSELTLYECDDNEDAQQWFFTQQTIKGKRLYRVCSEDNGYCLERSNNDAFLDRFDRNDKDQLLILASGFFDTN